jgi:hypothetical protein
MGFFTYDQTRETAVDGSVLSRLHIAIIDEFRRRESLRLSRALKGATS